MLPFTIEKPHSIQEAIAASSAGGRYIAGGTTLVDLMREHVERPERLININELPLNGIRTEGETLILGALARMSEIAAHPDTLRLQPLVAESLIEGASPQLRNMASIGGNLLQRTRCPYFRLLDAPCNKRAPGTGCSAIHGLNAGHAIFGGSDDCVATHPSDVAVALIALDATVRVQGPTGERSFLVEELFRLPGNTPHIEHTLRPGELILDVRIPAGRYAQKARYLKVRDRSSYEFAVVSVAAALDIRNGMIQAARIAAGGVGTKPWRMRASEALLVGKPLNRTSFLAAAAVSREGAQPLAANHYKVDLLPRAMIRALEMAGEV